MTSDGFVGCLLGLALGDAIGAPYEGGPVERLVWRFIGKTGKGKTRWTDDTQMALDLAESLLEHGGLNVDDLAQRFAANYTWTRGYGPATAKLLKGIGRGHDWRVANRASYRDGSLGNGGAMRAPVVGLFYSGRPTELAEAARMSAMVTHAHPLGVEGAVLVAAATAVALQTGSGPEIFRHVSHCCKHEAFESKLAIVASWLETGSYPGPREVTRRLGNGITATESCVTALYIAIRFLNGSFEDMMGFIISGAGDTVTIGAMAGAVWGAARGSSCLPSEQIAQLEGMVRIKDIASALHEQVNSNRVFP